MRKEVSMERTKFDRQRLRRRLARCFADSYEEDEIRRGRIARLYVVQPVKETRKCKGVKKT
jgi:hypothetical protein